jgi:hypothetical protein
MPHAVETNSDEASRDAFFSWWLTHCFERETVDSELVCEASVSRLLTLIADIIQRTRQGAAERTVKRRRLVFLRP